MIHFRTTSSLLPLSLLCALIVFSAPSTARSAPSAELPCTIPAGFVVRAADSPYDASCNVSVPAGATLTIEPGGVLRLGANNSITVDGAISALGTAENPIEIGPLTEGRAWMGIKINAGASATEFAHTTLTGGGARRSALLEIHSSAVTVRESRLENSEGTAVDIQGGASPTIRDSAIVAALGSGITPAGALRVFSGSEAVVSGNLFQSNIIPVYVQLDSNPVLEGNRFEVNGWDGVRIGGDVTGQTVLRSLGPRRWRYWLDPSGSTIREGATLEIRSGATIAVETVGFKVAGTLRVLGQAGGQVVFTTNSLEPRPGRWGEITFMTSSTPYDDETGNGSLIRHARFEYGGGGTTGTINIQGSSPRIESTEIRASGGKGVHVALAGASPTILGLRVTGLMGEQGIGVFATGGATPLVAFSIFAENRSGVVSETGAQPVVSPFNRFDRNFEFAMANNDTTVCLHATSNDWLSVFGPLDPSSSDDSCGLGVNDSDGGFVTDAVDYRDWVGTIARPYLISPHCGSHRGIATITGMAPSGSTVLVYDNFELLGETQAEASSEEYARFEFEAPDLESGSHSILVRAETESGMSGISDPVDVYVDRNQLVDPSGMHVAYELDGIRYAQGLNDAAGCSSLIGGEWDIRVHPKWENPTVGETTMFSVPVVCPSGGAAAEISYQGAQIPLSDAGGNVFEGEFEPGTGGPISLEVTCGNVARTYPLGTVGVEYNGFLYDSGAQIEEPVKARVRGAEVRLYQLRPGAGWVLWPAADTFEQENPQVTGVLGWYGFYPPPGTYRITVEHPAFLSFTSEPVHITTQPFMLTVGLERIPRIFLPALANKWP